MKIAIMGAGLSGLSCAIILEQNGIIPTIYESRAQVGDRFVNGEIILSILNRPINDMIAHLAEQYGIFLKPTGNIKELTVYSENEMAKIQGQLGFNNIRGRDEESYEMQLAKQVKSNIIFNSKYTYEDLLREYTHIVLATGDAAYAMTIQNYRQDLTVTLRGAMVEGDFNRYSAATWLDNRFAPMGYGYFIPISEKEANIVIAYPDYDINKEKDIDYLWDLFYNRVCLDFKQNLRITEKFEVTRYIIGICQSPRVGNTFFVGNNFGSIMPFLGFGQTTAILTGIYAAQDLCGISTYEKLVKPLQKAYKNSIVLRRAMEKLDNSKLDFMVKNMNKKIVDRVFNTKRMDPLKYLSYLLRPIVLNKIR